MLGAIVDHLAALVLFAAHATICIRLLAYRRAGARYRWQVSAAAWVLIVSSGSTALGVALGRYPGADIHAADVGIAVVLSLLCLTARGDLAAIFRTHPDDQP